MSSGAPLVPAVRARPGAGSVPSVRSERVVLPDGIRPATLHIEGGTIARVGRYDEPPSGPLIDVGALTISPGVVDSHVHVNEPGRTEWEGFDTATRAAAAGGVTTIVDMPLNSIPATTTGDALDVKRRAARGRVHVDVGFWGGIVPGNTDQIGPLLTAGVRGFKSFLSPSGVAEFESVSEHELSEALPTLAARGDRTAPLLVHAEDSSLLRTPQGDPRSYRAYAASRPAQAEASAIALLAALSLRYGVAVHVVHVSSADGVEAVARARATGATMTAETCPHYLAFEERDVADGATSFKCAPPIRDARHRDALWQGLATGTLQLIASDHSPSPPSMKALDTGSFFAAWGGISSLQLSLAAVWTEARRRGFTEADLARWMSSAPARLSRLAPRKGTLEAGADADFVVWSPDLTFVVRADRLCHRHPLTPYEGRTLAGVVHSTFVRGECVWRDNALVRAGHGLLL